MSRLILAWLALAALILLWVHAATRRDDDLPDVQPWDERTVTLASASMPMAGDPRAASSSRRIVAPAAARRGQMGLARNAARSAAGMPTASVMNVARSPSRSPASRCPRSRAERSTIPSSSSRSTGALS